MMHTDCVSGSTGTRNRISEKRRGATSWLFSQGFLVTMVLIALLSALSGCGPGQTDSGQTNSVPVSLSISMPEKSAASASTIGSRFWATVQSWLPTPTNAWAQTPTPTPLSAIQVDVTGTDLEPISMTKAIPPNTSSGSPFTIDLDVPVGRDRVFTVSGFVGTGNLRFQGKSNPTTLTAGQAASVDVILIDITTGTVTGTVTNAVNGRPIPSASVRIVNTNLQRSADTNGSFTLNDVPQGPQTVAVTAPGFIANSVPVNVVPRQTQPVGISLSPVTLNPGQIRIILNWGRTPNDLDAHLLVPTPSTTEVCFLQRGILTSSPFAQLDTDEKFHSDPDSRLGPETITIAAPSAVPPPRFAGTYRYFVRNFRLAERDLLTSSGASIQVVTGDNDTEIARFTIPTTGTGRDWEVFTLDGATGSITPIEGSNGRITTIPTSQCPPPPPSP